MKKFAGRLGSDVLLAFLLGMFPFFFQRNIVHNGKPSSKHFIAQQKTVQQTVRNKSTLKIVACKLSHHTTENPQEKKDECLR